MDNNRILYHPTSPFVLIREVVDEEKGDCAGCMGPCGACEVISMKDMQEVVRYVTQLWPHTMRAYNVTRGGVLYGPHGMSNERVLEVAEGILRYHANDDSRRNYDELLLLRFMYWFASHSLVLSKTSFIVQQSMKNDV